MIETPSLRTRVLVVTAGVVLLLVVALDLFVYLSLRDRLEDTLDEVLAARVDLVEGVAETTATLVELDRELERRGIPAVVRTPTGEVVTSAPEIRPFDQLPPGTAPRGEGDRFATLVLEDGTSIDVYVSRASTEATLDRVLLLELVGSGIAVLLAVALLGRAAKVISRPLDRMTQTANDIAMGDRSRRLHPSDPTTELGRMAVTFDHMVDALDAAVTEAEAAEVRSRRFLADAAHQLRTPLAGLRASAETLVTQPEGPDRDRLASNIARESARLSRLVASLLRVARLDRGEALHIQAVDLAPLLADEVERQRALAPGLRFDEDGKDHVSNATVSCDPDAVRDVVANLLDNARRFARTTITVSLATQPDGVEIRVGDDGPGFGEDPEVIFDRFVSGDGGTGLGLPIARGIARQHGGDVVAIPPATVVLRLPVNGAGR